LEIIFKYNGIGELLEQTDASGNKKTISYDSGGRITSESWNNGNSKAYYYYPVSGLLQKVTSSNGSELSFTYDSNLRLSAQSEKVDDQNIYTRSYTYNSLGQLTSSTTNSTLTESYTYNSRGFNDQVYVNGNLVWKAYSQNKYGKIDIFKVRNNNETTMFSFDQYGFISGIQTYSTKTLQNWSYTYDPLTGNMLSRTGLKTDGSAITESFIYDNQDRLTSSTFSGKTTDISYDSDGKGNILSKADVGTYNYGENVHKLQYISDPTYRLSTLPSQQIEFTPFKKVSCILQTIDSLNTRGLNLVYGPDDERIKQVISLNNQAGLTKYYAFGDFEKETNSAGTSRELYYINTPSGTVAVVEVRPDSTNYFYIHQDVLGSFDLITKANGNIKERNCFDPWGQRRNSWDWSTDTLNTTLFTGRGFTGHEHLTGFNLINMNGKVYDPTTGMFISPDKYIQSPGKVQNFNRYTYCFNNPLKYTDPSGNYNCPWYSWGGTGENFRPPMFGSNNDYSFGSTCGPYPYALRVGNDGYSAGPSSKFWNDWCKLSAGEKQKYENKYDNYAKAQQSSIEANHYYMVPFSYTDGEVRYIVVNGKLQQIALPMLVLGFMTVKVEAQGQGDGLYRVGELTFASEAALRQYIAIVVGESSNNRNEAAGIGSVIKNRLAFKRATLNGDFVSKIGGAGQFDAIGGAAYNTIMRSSLESIFDPNNEYATTISGALMPLALNKDFSNEAYFWNASSPRTGFNWDCYNNGTFSITTNIGGTTFFKYSNVNKTWP